MYPEYIPIGIYLYIADYYRNVKALADPVDSLFVCNKLQRMKIHFEYLNAISL